MTFRRTLLPLSEDTSFVLLTSCDQFNSWREYSDASCEDTRRFLDKTPTFIRPFPAEAVGALYAEVKRLAEIAAVAREAAQAAKSRKVLREAGIRKTPRETGEKRKQEREPDPDPDPDPVPDPEEVAASHAKARGAHLIRNTKAKVQVDAERRKQAWAVYKWFHETRYTDWARKFWSYVGPCHCLECQKYIMGQMLDEIYSLIEGNKDDLLDKLLVWVQAGSA